MPTLIGSCSIWYSSRHERWLTPHELLVTQGFPVHLRWSHGRACCSFAQRLHDMVPTRGRPSRASVCKMAGNSMHTNVAGIILLYALTQVGIDKALVRLLVRAAAARKRSLVMSSSHSNEPVYKKARAD